MLRWVTWIYYIFWESINWIFTDFISLPASFNNNLKSGGFLLNIFYSIFDYSKQYNRTNLPCRPMDFTTYFDFKIGHYSHWCHRFNRSFIGKWREQNGSQR